MGKRESILELVTDEERRKVFGTIQEISSDEGISCVHCPCYTSCTRC